jgi:hypothetical protein
VGAQPQAVTQVEQYVRDRVAATGEPCLMVPPGRAPSLLAVPSWWLFEVELEGVYVLITGNSMPKTDEAWADATRTALRRVERWAPEPPEGVAYNYVEGALDGILRAEVTALGVSLLQLALNRAGSGLVIEVLP